MQTRCRRCLVILATMKCGTGPMRSSKLCCLFLEPHPVPHASAKGALRRRIVWRTQSIQTTSVGQSTCLAQDPPRDRLLTSTRVREYPDVCLYSQSVFVYAVMLMHLCSLDAMIVTEQVRCTRYVHS